MNLNYRFLNKELSFSNKIEPNGFVYKSSVGDEAIITYNEQTNIAFGSLKTIDGSSFAIEKCGDGYVLKEYNVTTFGEDKALFKLGNMRNLPPKYENSSQSSR